VYATAVVRQTYGMETFLKLYTYSPNGGCMTSEFIAIVNGG